MPHHIPVPAKIKITLFGSRYGVFEIFPEAKRGGDGLEIVGWTVKDKEGLDRQLFDVLAQTVLPRSLMHEVCRLTFERPHQPSVPVEFEVGDESWQLHMRAVEKEHETVHYEVEIDGEWMEMIDTYVGDLIHEDYFIFAENEVRPNVDFGHEDEILAQMN